MELNRSTLDESDSFRDKGIPEELLNEGGRVVGESGDSGDGTGGEGDGDVSNFPFDFSFSFLKKDFLLEEVAADDANRRGK